MALDLLPFSDWAAGTLQNSVPANTNALRSEVLAAHVISDSVTAQPGTPSDGDCYIIPTGRTGTQWATFAIGSLAYFRGGAWYEFSAYEGLLKVVGAGLKLYTSGAWSLYGGGGFGNPMTTAGDLIIGGTGGAATRLPIGSEGQVLKVVSGVPAYAAESGGGSSAERIDASWAPIITGGGTATATGTNAPTATGTALQRGVATTNQGTARARVAYQVTTPSTTAVAGVRWTNNIVYRATGFRVVGGWMMSNGGTVSTHRVFCGVRIGTGVPTDVNPSTLTSMAGFGYDDSDTSVQFMHNDASGTATKVSTGIAKPTTNDSAAFIYSITCTPGGNIQYSITELVSGTTFSGTAETDIPATTDALIVNDYASVGGTSSAIACDFYGKTWRFGSA